MLVELIVIVTARWLEVDMLVIGHDGWSVI